MLVTYGLLQNVMRNCDLVVHVRRFSQLQVVSIFRCRVTFVSQGSARTINDNVGTYLRNDRLTVLGRRHGVFLYVRSHVHFLASKVRKDCFLSRVRNDGIRRMRARVRRNTSHRFQARSAFFVIGRVPRINQRSVKHTCRSFFWRLAGLR